MVQILLRLEGLIIFFTALYVFHIQEGNWLVFFLLLLLPDIGMIGYVKDKKLGAIIYNISHTYITPAVLIFLGIVLHNQNLMLLGVIFFAHISIDRFCGFGLKYPSAFKDTHIQKV